MPPTQLQLVLVTPEKTLLDEPVDSLRFPLFDGQFGVLPGRAPAVARLGYGELRIRAGGGEQSFYIDGGFVQIKGSVVTLLTDRAMPSDELDEQDAAELLQEATSRVTRSEAEFVAKERDQLRARQMLTLARRN